MLKCKILDVQGFDPAIHGMRNPKNSCGTSQTVMMQLIVVNVE